MSSRTGTVHPQYYKSVTAGQTMYLQADTANISFGQMDTGSHNNGLHVQQNII